jgi:hemin uptake protein HemP
VEDTLCLATDISFMDRLNREDRTVFSAMLFQILAEILAHRLRITSEELVQAKEEIVRLRKGAGVRKTA